MNYLSTVFLYIVYVAFVDVLINEFIVKQYLLVDDNWAALHNFWKDSIPDDKWYRIRYAIVLNALGIAMVIYFSQDIYCVIIYFYFLLINSEHILYQWICGFVISGKKLFDLSDEPGWMEGLPWNKWLARYHGKPVVTSEEILTVFVLGLIIFLWVNFI